MAALMPQAKQQYFDASGNPLSGGKIYTYAAGTTTPLATYTTAAAGTPNANPVILDSRGEASIFFSAASYKIVVTTSADVAVWTVDNLAGDAAAAALASLAASSGSSLVGFIQAGTGAVASTVQAKMRESVSVLDFYANGVSGVAVDPTGVVDSTLGIQAAINAAVGKMLYFPKGTYLAAGLTTAAGAHIMGDGTQSIIKKNANGSILNLEKYGIVEGIYFDGNKATYTGSAIDINTGANSATPSAQGHQLIRNCDFIDVDGYGVHYTAANLGWMSKVENCRSSGTNADAFVKWPDEAATGGNRSVINCYSSNPLVNAGGCDNGMIIGNTCGGIAATDQGVVFPAGTVNGAKKVIVSGNRFAIAAGTVTVRGSDHTFTANIIAGSVDFISTTGGIKYDSSNIVTGTVADNSVNLTNIIDWSFNYTPTWTSSGTAVSLGNGSVLGRVKYINRRAFVDISFTPGSTTTFGTGTYTFSAPTASSNAANAVSYVGSAYALESGVAFKTGAVFLSAASTSINVLTDGGGNVWGQLIPFTWKNGDYARISINYDI